MADWKTFSRAALLALAAFAILLSGGAHAALPEPVRVSGYASIQAAIDANPGRVIEIPAGDYPTTEALRLTTDDAGLIGTGRIIQHNQEQGIVRMEGARRLRISGLTLTRPEGMTTATQEGVMIKDCVDAEVAGVRVINNRSKTPVILVLESTGTVVRDSLVENYKCVTIDDRTDSPLLGYAFRCIDGTGICVRYSTATMILSNRIVERTYLPTRAIRDAHGLGDVTIVPAVRGRLTPEGVMTKKYTANWHQGSGIVVTGLGESNFTQLTGNYIENAGQGIDIHSDFVVVSNNIVNHAMIGMKAMHGSRHVLISGNQFAYADQWGIMLMPGAASHPATAATDKDPARVANTDGGSVVVNNIISNFGFGNDYWNRSENGQPRNNAPIALLAGQLPENPPLKDVLVMGNVIYSSGKDSVIEAGQPTVAGPRYKWAIHIENDKQPAPQNVRIINNLCDPGLEGICNLPGIE